MTSKRRQLFQTVSRAISANDPRRTIAATIPATFGYLNRRKAPEMRGFSVSGIIRGLD